MVPLFSDKLSLIVLIFNSQQYSFLVGQLPQAKSLESKAAALPYLAGLLHFAAGQK